MIETTFKQSEIGLIPEDWETQSVSEFSDVITGGTPNTQISLFWGGSIRWMNSGELNLKQIYDVAGRITEFGLRSSSTKMIPSNCVLIGLAGQGKTRGTAAFNHIPLCINQSIGAIIPNNKFDSIYLYYYIENQYNNIRLLSSGDGGRGGLNKKILLAFIVAFPPSKKEQQYIATALSDVDALISALDKKIEKKKLIKQGAMQQLLTGKKRLQGFTEPWVSVTIDDLFDIGNGYTPSKAIPSYWENGTIPWFRMEDIRTNGRILKDSIQHVTKSAVKSSGLFPAYSIILSTTATIGEHALLTVDSIANQRFIFMIRKQNRYKDIDILYFFHYCFILGDWCRGNINEGGLMAVDTTDLKNYTFAIPTTLSEQTAIAEILSDMDKEIADLEAKRSKYEQIKQGMMQQLLTGKIRLIDK